MSSRKNIKIKPVRREPDLRRLAKALINLVLEQQKSEAAKLDPANSSKDDVL